MTKSGAWALFFETGLPQAYLLAKNAPDEQEQPEIEEELACPAFSAQKLTDI